MVVEGVGVDDEADGQIRPKHTIDTGAYLSLCRCQGRTGRGLGSNHIPKRGHKSAPTNGSAASPGSSFLTGT